MVAILIIQIILFIFQITYGYLATKSIKQGNRNTGNTYLIISNIFMMGILILCALQFTLN